MPRIRRPGIKGNFESLESALAGTAMVDYFDKVDPLYDAERFKKAHPESEYSLEEIYMMLRKRNMDKYLHNAMKRRMERQQDMGIRDTQMFPSGTWYRAPYNFMPGRRM